MINQEMKELGCKASAIRELFEYGKKRKQEIGEKNVFDFSIGNPSVPAPSIVNETLIKLINENDSTKLHGYTSAVGDNLVRKSIVEYLNKTYHANLDYRYVYMTAGAAASLTISLNAILEDNDEVIVLAPYFPEYKVFIEKAKGKVVVVESDKNTFLPNFEKIEKAINNNTKAIIINSPNNPTGVVYDESIIRKLSTILKKKSAELNQTIYLISDEPYRELIYSDIKYPFVTNYYDDSIVCYSFSKSLSLPGERIGYIVLSNTMNNVQDVFYAICGSGRSLGFVCAPALFQYMIPNCLGYTSDIEIYKENRNILSKALTEYGYEVINPDGAFYLFVKSTDEDAKAFCEYAKKYELLLVPSDSFGCGGYIRISYCVSKEQILNALPAFKKLIEDFRRG